MAGGSGELGEALYEENPQTFRRRRLRAWLFAALIGLLGLVILGALLSEGGPRDATLLFPVIGLSFLLLVLITDAVGRRPLAIHRHGFRGDFGWRRSYRETEIECIEEISSPKYGIPILHVHFTDGARLHISPHFFLLANTISVDDYARVRHLTFNTFPEHVRGRVRRESLLPGLAVAVSDPGGGVGTIVGRNSP